MALFDRAVPPLVRRAVYAIYNARAALDRWSVLGELPRFGVVVPDRVYRSGAPRSARHLAHLATLGLKSVVCVRGGGPTPLVAALSGPRVIPIDLGPDCAYSREAVYRAATTTLDPANQPALICCDGGRHRAGMVVAQIRLLMGWTLAQALDEYYRFAEPWPFADNVLFIASCAPAAWPTYLPS